MPRRHKAGPPQATPPAMSQAAPQTPWHAELRKIERYYIDRLAAHDNGDSAAFTVSNLVRELTEHAKMAPFNWDAGRNPEPVAVALWVAGRMEEVATEAGRRSIVPDSHYAPPRPPGPSLSPAG